MITRARRTEAGTRCITYFAASITEEQPVAPFDVVSAVHVINYSIWHTRRMLSMSAAMYGRTRWFHVFRAASFLVHHPERRCFSSSGAAAITTATGTASSWAKYSPDRR